MKLPFLIILSLFLLEQVVFSENSTFYYNRGVESFKAGSMTDAETNFKKAVEVNPSYTLGHYGLGRVYLLRKDKVSEAVRELKISVSLDPGLARGWFKLGLAELVSGKYMDSLHSFKEAYDRDKTFIEALYNMGVIYDLLGDEYLAFTYYRQYYRKTKGLKDDFF